MNELSWIGLEMREEFREIFTGRSLFASSTNGVCVAVATSVNSRNGSIGILNTYGFIVNPELATNSSV